MIDIKNVADNADMIINGYAYTKENEKIRVLNLNNVLSAAVLSSEGEILETNMPDIEAAIAVKYYTQNREFMEDAYAEVL
ncbi:MAG: hypothetical protein LUC41_03955 [Clostridiales bacterium]|nr:hypothetical protein [Clostridiales bacterium]